VRAVEVTAVAAHTRGKHRKRNTTKAASKRKDTTVTKPSDAKPFNQSKPKDLS